MSVPTFNNYTIIRKIGKGGMATVYLAEHNRLRNHVAIKVLEKQYFFNSNIKNRFIDEAIKMANTKHQNIISVTDIIEDDEKVAFIMEYIDGNSLKEIIEKRKLTNNEIEHFLKQMVDAVKYIHANDIIHRDIKPSNFLVSKDNFVKLTDFGISKDISGELDDHTLTATGVSMGTLTYMSPEQIRDSGKVTKATDIYSLGVVLWEMVSGERLYKSIPSSAFGQFYEKITTEELPLTNTKWDEIIQKATKKGINVRTKYLHEFLDSNNRTEKTIETETQSKDNKNKENNDDGFYIIIVFIVLALITLIIITFYSFTK